MNMDSKVLAVKVISMLVTLGIMTTVIIHDTENDTHQHEMSWRAASIIAGVLVLIVAPFAYRYFKTSGR